MYCNIIYHLHKLYVSQPRYLFLSDPLPLGGGEGRMLLATSSGNGESSLMPLLRLGTASILSYSTLLNGAIAVLFKLRRGMSLIGKDRRAGTIPMWSCK